MEERSPSERRISGRVDVEPIAVAWLTTDQVASRRLRISRPTPVEHPGWIVNLSTTGAGVLGPEHPDLKPRMMGVLVFEGGRSKVVIRRVTGTDRPGLLYYGVELEELDDRLRDVLFSLLGRGRPGEQSWRQAW